MTDKASVDVLSLGDLLAMVSCEQPPSTPPPSSADDDDDDDVPKELSDDDDDDDDVPTRTAIINAVTAVAEDEDDNNRASSSDSTTGRCADDDAASHAADVGTAAASASHQGITLSSLEELRALYVSQQQPKPPARDDDADAPPSSVAARHLLRRGTEIVPSVQSVANVDAVDSPLSGVVIKAVEQRTVLSFVPRTGRTATPDVLLRMFCNIVVTAKRDWPQPTDNATRAYFAVTVTRAGEIPAADVFISPRGANAVVTRSDHPTSGRQVVAVDFTRAADAQRYADELCGAAGLAISKRVRSVAI